MTNFITFVDKKPILKLDITAYIRELLFGHDCVIIPGFGGFICNYVPARIDRASNMFYPPVRQVSFNRNLNNNDGLLIGRISESSEMNYGDARNLVTDFVEGIKRKLSKGEKVIFEHIGTFMNNHEGNVQFEPDRDVNYHLDSYGLAAFAAEPLEGYDVKQKLIRTGGTQPSRQVPLRKILWRAAVIVPLLGVLIAVPLTTDILKNKTQTTSLNPLASVEFEAAKADAARAEEERTTVPLSVTGKDEAALNATVPENPSEAFYLIAGSFKSESNAEALLEMLEQDGYKPELISGPNGFLRVSAMRFNNLDEAIRLKDSVGRKYPDTWIARGK